MLRLTPPPAFTLLLFAAPIASAAPLEEMIVTAHKREQPAHTLPASVSVLHSEVLQQRRLESVEQVLDSLVNVSRNASNDVNSGFTIRGVGTSNFHGNVNRSVGVYLDEVVISNPYSGTLSSFDLAQIEVMRGPQNIFFGRNSNAGAIQLTSQKPTPGEGNNGYAQLSLGSESLTTATGAVGFDTGDNSAARLAGLYSSRDGTFDNLAQQDSNWGDKQRQALRLSWLWQPTEQSKLDVMGNYAKTDDTNIGNRTLGLRDPEQPNAPCNASLIEQGRNFEDQVNCVDATGMNPSTGDWHQLYNVSGGQQQVEFSGATIRYQQSLGALLFTSITGYQSTEVELAEDLGGSDNLRFIAFQDSEFDQWSQEFRLSSDDQSPLNWQVGVSYFNEDTLQGTQARRVVIANGLPATSHNLLDQQDRDLSIFGQLNIPLSEQLTLSLGGRYTDNLKTADSFFAVVRTPEAEYPSSEFIDRNLMTELIGSSPGPCPPSVGGLPCTMELKGLEQQLHEFAPSVSASYELNDNGLMYLSYAEGFKAGGFDTRALAAFAGTADKAVAPEYLDSIELGTKFFWPAQGLRINSALFHYQWQGQQVFDVSDSQPQFVNIPESELLGAEFELNWLINSQWRLDAGLGWLDTEVTDSGDLLGVDQGHNLTNAPQWSATLGLERSFSSRYGEINLGFNSQYLDEQTDSLNFADDRYAKKNSQLYLDAYAQWIIDGGYEVKLWGQNLTEEKTCRQIAVIDSPGSASPGDLLSTLPCNPSEGMVFYGVDLRINFE